MASQPKSYSRSVTSGEQRLLIQAVAAKASWSFYILHQELDGEKFITIARGASAKYPNFETARTAVDAAVHKALTIGWPSKEPSQSLRNLARNVREIKIYDPKAGRRR